MDDNLNTLPNADFFNRGYLIGMIDRYTSFMNDNNLVFMNFEATRFLKGVEPSCLDHIATNCPDKLYNINTVKSFFSDHCCLVANYKNKKIIYINQKKLKSEIIGP